MKHSRIAMLGIAVVFVCYGGYSLVGGQVLRAAVASLNTVLALLTFRRMKDAPRAV